MVCTDLQAPPFSERDGNGGGTHVARHLGDQDDVVIAKGEPGILDLATQPLDGGANSFNSILPMGEQGLPAFPRSTQLGEENLAYYLFEEFLAFSEPRYSTPARGFRTLLNAFFIGGIPRRGSRRAHEGFGYFSALPKHPARNERSSSRCRRFAMLGFSSGKWRMVNRYSAMNQSGWSVVIQSS